MKFNRSKKFDLCYYGQVNLQLLNSTVASKYARKLTPLRVTLILLETVLPNNTHMLYVVILIFTYFLLRRTFPSCVGTRSCRTSRRFWRSSRWWECEQFQGWWRVLRRTADTIQWLRPVALRRAGHSSCSKERPFLLGKKLHYFKMKKLSIKCTNYLAVR